MLAACAPMPGEIYECGCADILLAIGDCEGNQLDALEVWWRLRCGRRCR